MNTRTLFGCTFMTICLAGCGGSSSGDGSPSTTTPISVTITNAPLSAGVPSTFTYTIPAPVEPYTDVTIDLAKTLQSASLTVTPTP